MARKVKVYDVKGSAVKEITLPSVFDRPYRSDLIKRAFLALMSHLRQPYGADPMAGKRTSAEYRGRRRDYGSWANRGLHRTKRIRVGSGHMTGVVRFVPQAVKGRRAHPPLAEKVWYQEINKKERVLAILSAIAGSSLKDFVSRVHRINELDVPVVVEDALDTVAKTKELEMFLRKIGLEEELDRIKEKKVRAGKGKLRGRRYKKKKGPLIVTANPSSALFKSAPNLGIDVVYYDHLNIGHLSPSGKYPRLVIYTEGALEKIKEKYGGI
ncbi:MAG: 50S ribosomal protein L4 [Candidatus Nanohaloarchaeota archaeon]|nr:50S ribosomal protein L4 [Candidatus Nanohaloarchaeota archaeon]